MSSMARSIKNKLKGTALGALISRQKNKQIANREILSAETATAMVEKYMSAATPEEKMKTVADVLDMARKYRFSAEEYFYYHFATRTEEERRTFISDLNRVDFCDSVNQAKNKLIFDDKMRSTEVFGKYYGREFCAIKSGAELQKLKEFVQAHPKFIAKPLFGSRGMGI